MYTLFLGSLVGLGPGPRLTPPRLREPSWPATAPFDLGAKVEVWWPKTGQWYSATVTAAYEDYQLLCVAFEQAGYWGAGARGLPYDHIRAVPVTRWPWT